VVPANDGCPCHKASKDPIPGVVPALYLIHKYATGVPFGSVATNTFTFMRNYNDGKLI